MKRSSTLALFLTVLVIICFSCKKENSSPSPDYVGTWVGEYSEPLIGIKFKETRTLTNNSFSNLTQFYDSNSSKWIDLNIMKGDISVRKDTMIFNLTEYGVSSFDNVTKNYTGVITSYKEGSSGFESLCSSMLQPKLYYFLFDVSGNHLTSKLDLNDDGDFDDENETLILTKQ